MFFAIQAAQHAECVQMIIESDSTEVVDLFLNMKGNKTQISWTSAEIQASLKGHNLSSTQNIPRVCNVIAHSLARIPLEFENHVIWLEKFSVQIMTLLSKFV